MKVTTTKLPKSQVKLEIEISSEKLEKFKDKAIKKMAENVKIDGFRPGKVPYDVLLDHFGKEALSSFIVDEALGPTYAEAVLKEKLQIVSKPKINIISSEPLKYEVIVAILPEITLPALENIKIKKQEIKVIEKDVDEFIDELRKKKATFSEIDLEIKKGDKAEINFQGTNDKGESEAGMSSKNHPLIIGDKVFLEEFEENLIGLKKGDKKKFEVTFPKDYHHKKYQNKAYKFEVEILKVYEVKLADVNEAFIEEVLKEKKSVEDFKKKIKEDLQVYREEEEKEKRRNMFLEEMVTGSKLEIPDQLIEEELDYIIEEIKENIASQGLPWDQFEKYLKEKGRDLRKENVPEAEKRIKVRLVVGKAFEDSKIEVDDIEVQKEIEKVLNYYPEKERDHVREHHKKGGSDYNRLANNLRLNKLFEKYL